MKQLLTNFWSRWKKDITSALITFVSVFFLTLGTLMQSLDVDSLTTSAVFAVVIAAGRAGLKALWLFIINFIQSFA